MNPLRCRHSHVFMQSQLHKTSRLLNLKRSINCLLAARLKRLVKLTITTDEPHLPLLSFQDGNPNSSPSLSCPCRFSRRWINPLLSCDINISITKKEEEKMSTALPSSFRTLSILRFASPVKKNTRVKSVRPIDGTVPPRRQTKLLGGHSSAHYLKRLQLTLS